MEITIKIRGSGAQTIFRKRVANQNKIISYCTMPDEIFDITNNKSLIDVNNCKNTDNNFYNNIIICTCNLTVNISNNANSTIKMKWNNKPNSTCREMFMELNNIIEVDLSKLEVSLVDMGNLFKDCSYLK